MKNNLKLFREEAGLTFQQLGDACNTTKGHISHLEKCRNIPRLDSAYKIAKILQKSVYDIWPDTIEIEIEEQTIIIRRVIK